MLARSIENLIEWVAYLNDERIALKSVHDNIDTTTPTGKLTFHIFAAIGKCADAIVKGMLQHSRKSTGEKKHTNINALADEYLRLSYHAFVQKTNHSIQILKPILTKASEK